jgi:ribosome-associated translation inhibitor RaiA
MRMKKLVVFLMMGLVYMNAIAQNSGDEINEEELLKYATVEDSTAAYLEGKQNELENMIKNDETLGGAARYNQFKAAWGNEQKLEEINATAEEKEAYQKIQSAIENLGKDVVKYKTELIMNPEVLGAATYNKVKKAMDADPSVKEKVNSLIAELKTKRNQDTGN